MERVRLWSFRTRAFYGERRGTWIGFSRDGQVFLMDREGIPHAWKTISGERVDLRSLSPDQFDPPQRTLVRVKKHEDGRHAGLEVKDVFEREARQVWELNEGFVENWVLGNRGIAMTLWGDMGGHDWAFGRYRSLTGNREFSFDVNRFTGIPAVFLSEPHFLLAVNSGQLDFTLYDTRTGQEVREVRFDSGGGGAISISPDSRRLIAVHSPNKGFKVYYPQEARQVDESAPVMDLEFCGPYLACLLEGDAVRVYDTDTLSPA